VASPFEVLDIDPDASAAELRRAYRERVIEAHPDHGGSAAEFQRVREAYEAAKAGRELEAPPESEEIESEEKESETDDEPDGVRVEYLNYAVLDDHGWDVGDGDLFGKAGDADLNPVNHGKFLVQPGESLLEAAEDSGFAWPYACRGGACANCAVAVVEGELEMPTDTILTPEMEASGIRLSCNGIPITDELKVIYNIKHLPGLDELRLPPRPFEQAHASD
jgi:ferredoxin